MYAHHTDPLALSTALTVKTRQLCPGLEHGAADILERVTPTTAELLHWWFGQDMVNARSGLNFHTGQKQAIVAHEVLRAGSLLDLHQQVVRGALLEGTGLAEDVAHEWQGKGAHLAQLLDFARLRPLASASLQASLL